MPHRRPPPEPPFSTDRSLLADRVEEALERHDRERWERFVDATDPGELFGDLRINEDEIARGEWKLEWLFLLGDELFEHDFASVEGFGPGRRRIHHGPSGGPDALSCNECHHRGGFDGAGDLSQNAFFDGDGYAPESGFERNAPHVLGLGFVEKIGHEMTAALTAERDSAIFGAKISGKPVTAELVAKGVSFGSLTGYPDGTTDLSRVTGVQKDLVVRPFGWKGAHARIRDFGIDGFQRHHGMQVSGEELPGAGPTWDSDNDQKASELAPGMVTTITAYLALLDVPVMIPPKSPELLGRHARGWERFNKIGCGECHRSSLGLSDQRLDVNGAITVNLLEDGEAPRPRQDVFVGDVQIYLFSDLRLHDMGPELAESRPNAAGVLASVFLTRPLWGLADTAPYLHDGRANTIDEAILSHGGEAAASRDEFAALSQDAKADVRIFLLSLSRYPRIDFK